MIMGGPTMVVGGSTTTAAAAAMCLGFFGKQHRTHDGQHRKQHQIFHNIHNLLKLERSP